MRRPSIHVRTRIALWVAAISGALLVFMAVSVFGVFEQQLVASLDDTLGLRAEANRQLVDLTTSPPSLRIVRDPSRELITGEAVLRLYRGDGTLLDDASPATGLTGEERAAVLAAAGAGDQIFRTVDLGDDEDYRVVATPLTDRDPNGVVLVTGLEQSRVDGPLRILRIILAVAVPVTVAGSALGGYWVAQRALEPVSAMAATAERITHGDLAQRVPGADARDELGHLATTLNAMLARLSEAVERERRFTADAAHELRTPLAAIEAGIDVTLAADRPAEEYRRVLAVVRGQTRRLDRLANQLLLLSRLDAGEVRASFTPVELTGLVEAVAEAFGEAHPEATIVLEGADAPLTVVGDVELLARAVTNLLENAVAHVGARVGIALGTRREGDHAVVAVQDDGPGIPPGLAADVFRRFRRGDAARSGAGTGLGLSIVEAIAVCHGGWVALVPPQRAGGARFELALPLVVSHPR